MYLIMGCCPNIAGGRSERWHWGNHIRHPISESTKGALANVNTRTAINGAGPDLPGRTFTCVCYSLSHHLSESRKISIPQCSPRPSLKGLHTCVLIAGFCISFCHSILSSVSIGGVFGSMCIPSAFPDT